MAYQTKDRTIPAAYQMQVRERDKETKTNNARISQRTAGTRNTENTAAAHAAGSGSAGRSKKGKKKENIDYAAGNAAIKKFRELGLTLGGGANPTAKADVADVNNFTSTWLTAFHDETSFSSVDSNGNNALDFEEALAMLDQEYLQGKQQQDDSFMGRIRNAFNSLVDKIYPDTDDDYSSNAGSPFGGSYSTAA